MQHKRLLLLVLVLLLVPILVACSSDDEAGTDKETGEMNERNEQPANPAVADEQASPAEAEEKSDGIILEAEVMDDASADYDGNAAAMPAPTMLAMEPPTGAVVNQQAQIAATQAGASQALPTPQATPDAMFFEDYGVNPFFDTEDDNLSTFAMDVDTASYTVARNYLMNYQQLPSPDAIRPEEFINYFDANYPSPENDAFAIYLDAAPAPFGYEGHYLLRVGIQGKYIDPADRPAALLLFVIDVSGSMDMENRLGLVKESLALLVDELREDDRVGIAVYSDNSRIVLEPTPASDKATIMQAINNLQPEGSTNAEAGIRLGYQMAESQMREGEITRVIVLSDGVANVGNTGPDSILNQIEAGTEAGITLSTIGFGLGNYNDVLMEQLANDGNGNYYYVDNLREARRVFVHNLTGTLQVIGYDAKVQVEFNPAVTDRYRLIGYENRAVADEDFRDDSVDAGEVGAGHSITALYELALEDADASGIAATVYIRYRDADTDEVVELERAITVEEFYASFEAAPAEFRLLAAVAEFSELLRESIWAEDGNYQDLLTVANAAAADLGEDETVAEFVEMVRRAGRYTDQ